MFTTGMHGGWPVQELDSWPVQEHGGWPMEELGSWPVEQYRSWPVKIACWIRPFPWNLWCQQFTLFLYFM